MFTRERTIGGDHEIVRVEIETGAVAFRLPHRRPDPSTWAVRVAGALLGEESGLGPRLRAIDPASGVMIVDWIDGATALSQKPTNKSAIAHSLGAVLRRLHTSAHPVGLPHVSLVSLAHSLQVAPLFQKIAQILVQTQTEFCPSHGDLVPQNMIVEASGQIRLIDWDYAGMHDPCWDLAYAIQEIGFSATETEGLLAAYGRPLRPERLLLFRVLIIAINAAWRQAYHGARADYGTPLAAIFATHPAVLSAMKTVTDTSDLTTRRLIP
jgi:hypothetical protein